ncbi:MAG: hypothetical protein EI684_20770 [Candidatus Viridilinea halotolerans]|uniref:Uncharacterized protein n=1 Tax=Candidatus Viridilinea halotolerans TaxID=2491704 RepID=A0A426TRT8_9CHLR|nr:MAG: hypothetical protein EI684_20770 [Candidatus Viridilinea halotolerans]
MSHKLKREQEVLRQAQFDAVYAIGHAQAAAHQLLSDEEAERLNEAARQEVYEEEHGKDAPSQ